MSRVEFSLIGFNIFLDLRELGVQLQPHPREIGGDDGRSGGEY